MLFSEPKPCVVANNALLQALFLAFSSHFSCLGNHHVKLINCYFIPAAFEATKQNGDVSNLSQASAYLPLSSCEGEQMLL